MLRPSKYLPISALQEQLIDELRPLRPADWQYCLLNCELSADPAHPQASYAHVYLAENAAGEWATGNLPALPPDLTAQLIDLREALFEGLGTRWSSVELQLTNDYSGGQLRYGYGPPPRLSGRDDDEAVGRFDAPTFLARCLAARADRAADANEEQADYAAEAPASNAAPAARPAAPVAVVWVCTWCHGTYCSARQPTSFQPGKCPRNPGKAHAWHRQ